MNHQAASLCAGVTSKPTRGKCTFTLPTEGSSCRMTISSTVQARNADRSGHLRRSREAGEGKKERPKKSQVWPPPLRHFCSSLWIEANYSAKRVQTYMGHASIVQTYDTYGYLFDLRDNDK